MGPNNILLGDNIGIDLPQATPDESSLVDEKKMAKFTRTAEFKRIKEYCEERIKFYQKYLPNGLEVGLDVRPLTEDWMVANRVIGELSALINMYETSAEVVKEANEGLSTA